MVFIRLDPVPSDGRTLGPSDGAGIENSIPLMAQVAKMPTTPFYHRVSVSLHYLGHGGEERKIGELPCHRVAPTTAPMECLDKLEIDALRGPPKSDITIISTSLGVPCARSATTIQQDRVDLFEGLIDGGVAS
jgi:hypothetical protein